MLMANETHAMNEAWKEYQENLTDVFGEVLSMIEAKGEDYDIATPIWHRLTFGNQSFAHEVYKKAARIVELLKKEEEPRFDTLEDSVSDIAAYCLMWLATMRTDKHFAQEPETTEPRRPHTLRLRQ